MKNLLRKIINILNSLVLLNYLFKDRLWGNTFRFSLLKYKSSNSLNSSKSSLVKSTVKINGSNNKINLNQVSLMNCSIYIEGTNNRIEIEKHTHVNNKNIIIKGKDCLIHIGSNTTFFGGRIVNEGVSNTIDVGNDCLFSDQIEIWSSDTHPIYDSEEKLINPDKAIHIGSRVWIGCRVNILKGVNIADGAIVGMGSIVTKDIPERTISVGFPNKVIKEHIQWKRD